MARSKKTLLSLSAAANCWAAISFDEGIEFFGIQCLLDSGSSDYSFINPIMLDKYGGWVMKADQPIEVTVGSGEVIVLESIVRPWLQFSILLLRFADWPAIAP